MSAPEILRLDTEALFGTIVKKPHPISSYVSDITFMKDVERDLVTTLSQMDIETILET
jgi:hypothetical protein